MQRAVNSLVRRRLGEEKTLAASTRSRHGGDGDGGDDDGDGGNGVDNKDVRRNRFGGLPGTRCEVRCRT